MGKKIDISGLKEIAKNARIDVIKMLTEAKSGHSGGSLSEIEILVALYAHEMKHDPQNPCSEDRDRFVLSKGHGIPGVYAVGDVLCNHVKQAVIAAAEGAIAAIAVEKELHGRKQMMVDWSK